jgi:hypothetical protein
MLNKYLLSLLLALCLLSCSIKLVNAEDEMINHEKQVVIFIIDAITFTEFNHAHTPTIDSFIAAGAIGLLNTSTASGAARTAAYLTLGAGTRAAGSDSIEPALEITEAWGHESAADVLHRRVSFELEDNKILYLGIGEIIERNKSLPVTITPGLLGQSLAEAGISRALLGNADLPQRRNRPAAGVLMDTNGLIEAGVIGSQVVSKCSEAPFGIKTNTTRLLAEFQQVAQTSNVIVIEWGDTTRAEEYRQFCLPEVGRSHKLKAIAEADAFLAELQQLIDWEKTVLIIVSPATSYHGYRNGERLTPIIVVGQGIRPGLLSSPTTRWPGLVANIDIAPSILAHYQISPLRPTTGRPFQVIPKVNPLKELKILYEVSLNNFQQRPIIIKAYILFIIIALIGATLSIYGILRSNNWLSLLFAVATGPFALLILPIFSTADLKKTFMQFMLINLLLFFIFNSRRWTQYRSIIMLALVTVAALALDLLTGQFFLRRSLFSYCPISGARYYGIGNEYMGVFLGAGFIGFTGLADFLDKRHMVKLPLLVIGFGLLFILIFLAHPSLGVNLGGTIAVMGGTAMTILWLNKDFLSGRYFFACACGIVLFLIALGFGEWTLAQETSSHFGQTVQLLMNEGPWELFLIVQRKLALNFKLLRYSWWSLVLLVALLVFIIISVRPPRPLVQISTGYPYLWSGLVGGGGAALVALIVNDSGVVAAATALIFPITILLTLIKKEGGS